jgi:hypothetical protein
VAFAVGRRVSAAVPEDTAGALEAAPPVVASVGDLSDGGEFVPIKLGVVTLDAAGGKPKAKANTPASRLKELQAKSDLTDKERKVCCRRPRQMLGRILTSCACLVCHRHRR